MKGKIKVRSGTWRFNIQPDHVVLYTPSKSEMIVGADELRGHRQVKVEKGMIQRWILRHEWGEDITTTIRGVLGA
jgi:hypothetical protein